MRKLVKEILDFLKNEKKAKIRKINTTLSEARKYKIWLHLIDGLGYHPIDIPKRIIDLLESLPKGKYYTFETNETKVERKEGTKFSKYILDKDGSGIEITYEYKYIKKDITPDDYGDDYYTGIGVRKDIPSVRDFEYVLEPEIFLISTVSGSNIDIPYNVKEIYIPDFPKPRKPRKVNIERLKEIENLINALQKLKPDLELYFEVQINSSEDPRENLKLIISFNENKLLHYKIELDEYWNDVDEYLDLPESMRKDLELAEKVARKAINIILEGKIPDLDKLVEEERNKAEIEKRRDELIEKGQEMASEEDQRIIEEIDKEYKNRMKELLVGQKLRRKLSFKGTVIDKGAEITENTKIESLLPVFLYPEEYISDTEVIEQVQHLQKEKTRKFEEYYINLALQEKI